MSNTKSSNTSSIVVAALYKFVALPDYKDIQKTLQRLCFDNGIKGTLLLAEEGINGTVAATRQGIDALKKFLEDDERFHGCSYKESHADEMPFYRMKVRLKKEIVKLGVPGTSPLKNVGKYLSPEEWNELLKDPEVFLVDTRNDYEYEIGTFKGAANPNTQCFTQFPEYVKTHMDPKKHKKVAMFCTGGIRCEKSTAYMLDQGFEEVYHLDGGILKYLEKMKKEDSLWDGECFVFDNRVSIKHGLEIGEYELCHGCRFPITQEDKESDKFERGVSCPKCHDKIPEERKERARARQYQIDLAKKRNIQHIGATR